MDYLRYLHPIYKDAERLRQRALVWPSGLVLWIARLPLVRTPLGLRQLTRGLMLLERAIPSSAAVEAFVRAQRPDLMLLTPLVETASKQVDYVKAAQTDSLLSFTRDNFDMAYIASRLAIGRTHARVGVTPQWY